MRGKKSWNKAKTVSKRYANSLKKSGTTKMVGGLVLGAIVGAMMSKKG